MKERAKAREKAQKEAEKRIEKRRKEIAKAQEELEKTRKKIEEDAAKRNKELEKELAKVREEAKKARERGDDEEKVRKRFVAALRDAREEREKDDVELARAMARVQAAEAAGAYPGRTYDRRPWVRTGSYAVPSSRHGEGGWMELGGLTRSTNAYGRSGTAWGGESGSSSTSIGVRATVIRLGGTDDY